MSKCFPLFPQQRTFIKATTADSTLIDAARENPELIDKFADWLIALSSGGLFALSSNFLHTNQSHRSAAIVPQRFDHPPPWARADALAYGHRCFGSKADLDARNGMSMSALSTIGKGAPILVNVNGAKRTKHRNITPRHRVTSRASSRTR
jgi:hypothetical protein